VIDERARRQIVSLDKRLSGVVKALRLIQTRLDRLDALEARVTGIREDLLAEALEAGKI